MRTSGSFGTDGICICAIIATTPNIVSIMVDKIFFIFFISFGCYIIVIIGCKVTLFLLICSKIYVKATLNLNIHTNNRFAK